MSKLSGQNPELITARQNFVYESGRLARDIVSDTIFASWRRSKDQGVSPGRVESPYYADLDFSSRLVTCAMPTIEQLAAKVADLPTSIVLTDDQARILVRRDGSSDFGRALDRVNFTVGFGYAEGAVGTNGVGTVLESGTSARVTGAEHFVEGLVPFACTGAPIRDPITRRVQGVLDISCFANDWTPIMHSLVTSAAAEIEAALLADQSLDQQALFDAYARAGARSQDLVIAVGPRLLISPADISSRVVSTDQTTLEEYLRYVVDQDAQTVENTIDLPSGASLKLRGNTVWAGDEAAGMVFMLTRDREKPQGKAGPASVGKSSGLHAQPQGCRERTLERHTAFTVSPSMKSAVNTVTAALESQAPILVLGEEGSGRATLLSHLSKSLHPNGNVYIHEATAIERETQTVAAAVLNQGASSSPTALHVLKDLDKVSQRAVETLASELTASCGRIMFAATSTPLSAGATKSPLLRLFRQSATVPPLRHRTGDLPALSAALLEQLAPHSRVRLSPDAERLVTAGVWRGNFIELREALTFALRQRPVGTIEVSDLPASAQSRSQHQLRPVDQAERGAIVRALREVRGNRKAAAQKLGIARSTLYRKIRLYGITDG